MAARLVEKLHLNARGFLSKVREVFAQINEPLRGSQGESKNICVADFLMSALAIFKLKFPSLLQFETNKNNPIIKQNLKNLFKVKQVPCDSYLREQLDCIDPQEIRPVFKAIFSTMQRGKSLEQYQFIDRKYLMLSDGTGYFSSQSEHCANCCKKRHTNGSITYYHQFLGAVIAHPDRREVIPICSANVFLENV